ncbi:MAG: hypothetical protein ACN6O2_01215 [Stenotrophomonas sp.]
MQEDSSYGGGPALEIDIVGGIPESQVADQPYRATDEMSGMDRFRAGLGKSMVDTVYGVGQAVVDQASRPVSGLASLAARINPEAAATVEQNMLAPQRWFREKAAERRAADADLTDTTSGSAGKIVGDIGTMLIPGSAAARAPTIAGRVAGNALIGGAGGALQPVVSEQERNRNALVGGALGAAGGVVGEGLGALAGRARAAIDPTRRRMIELAEQQGIPLHISQISESIPMKAMASAAKYLPFSGAGGAATRQQEAFNRAISRTFGADAPKLTDEVMTAARQRISNGYEEIYARNNIPIDPAAIRELLAIETAAGRRLTLDQGRVVANQLDMILEEAANGGVLTGAKYQALRSQIMRAEGQDALGSAVREMRQALDGIAERSVGAADAEALRQLRGQWANLRTTQGLLQQVGGAAENVNPSRLWSAIRRGSTREMRDLARMGQTILKDPIPDSGTAGRLLSYGAIGQGGLSGGAAIPGILGLIGTGAVAGRALNSNMLARLAAQPGAATNALARTSPLASLATVPLVVGEPERLPDRDARKPSGKNGR